MSDTESSSAERNEEEDASTSEVGIPEPSSSSSTVSVGVKREQPSRDEEAKEKKPLSEEEERAVRRDATERVWQRVLEDKVNGASQPTVELLCGEDEEGKEQECMVVNKPVAEVSKTVKALLADLGGEYGQVPLPNVTADTMKHVLDFCKYWAAKGEREATEEEKHWERSFVDVDYTLLGAMLFAANYLSIEPLIDLICRRMADISKQTCKESDSKELQWTDELRARCGVPAGEKPTAEQSQKARHLLAAYALREEFGIDQTDLTPEDEDEILKEEYWAEDAPNRPQEVKKEECEDDEDDDDDDDDDSDDESDEDNNENDNKQVSSSSSSSAPSSAVVPMDT